MKELKQSMEAYHIRVGTIEDLPFLEKMLYEAVFWNPGMKRMPMKDLFAISEISRIFHHWNQREGDVALIAVNNRNNPVAAAWYRFWTDENHSYGYVDARTPEIGIAVDRRYRRKGIGKTLLQRIIAHAAENDIEQLSLSVDPSNFARILYHKSGFRKISETSTAWTMLKIL